MINGERDHLLALLVRHGVVGDLEDVEVEHVLHLVVVAASFADHGGHVKQE